MWCLGHIQKLRAKDLREVFLNSPWICEKRRFLLFLYNTRWLYCILCFHDLLQIMKGRLIFDPGPFGPGVGVATRAFGPGGHAPGPSARGRGPRTNRHGTLASVLIYISYICSSIPTNLCVLPLPQISGLEQDIKNPSYMYLHTNMWTTQTKFQISYSSFTIFPMALKNAKNAVLT